MKQILKKSSFLILSLILYSCVNNDLENDSTRPSSSILSAKTWFTAFESNGNNYVLFQNLDYDWSAAKIKNSEDGTETIVVPVKEVKKDQAEVWEQKLYLYKLDAGNYKALLYEIYPDTKSVGTNYSSIDGGNFNGYISTWDLKTGFVKAAKFVNDKVVENGIVEEKMELKNRTNKAPAIIKSDDDGTSGGGDPPGTPLREVVAEKKSPAYSNSGGYLVFSGSGGGFIGSNTGSYTSHSGGGGGSGDAATTSNIENNINSDKLDPCPKAVLDKLKNATNCDIANMLTKLGASKVYNLNIVSGYNGNPASTVRTASFNYTITVSQGYTTGTSLFRASNLAHEIVHAYFMSLKDDLSTNPTVFNDFPVLFQAFVDKTYPGSTFDAHHEQMANLYVNAIGSALQEYQTGLAVTEGTTPNQIYTDLAWGGLKGTPVYDNHFKDKDAERKRIENRYDCEGTGFSKGDQTPIGKPCN